MGVTTPMMEIIDQVKCTKCLIAIQVDEDDTIVNYI